MQIASVINIFYFHGLEFFVTRSSNIIVIITDFVRSSPAICDEYFIYFK